MSRQKRNLIETERFKWLIFEFLIVLVPIPGCSIIYAHSDPVVLLYMFSSGATVHVLVSRLRLESNHMPVGISCLRHQWPILGSVSCCSCRRAMCSRGYTSCSMECPIVARTVLVSPLLSMVPSTMPTYNPYIYIMPINHGVDTHELRPACVRHAKVFQVFAVWVGSSSAHEDGLDGFGIGQIGIQSGSHRHCVLLQV